MAVAGVVASRATKGRSNQISFNEALSSASYGLMRAASKYDPRKGQFSTSGYPRAMGQVSDDLRSRSKWFAYGPSKSNQTPQGIGSSAEQSCGNPEIEKFESVEQFEWMIKPLKSERHKQVLRLSYIENMTLEEVGKAIGFSESRCCQWRTEAIKELKDHYHGNDL